MSFLRLTTYLLFLWPMLGQTGQINIVTTTGMIADAVKNITQETAQVRPLMGSGVDPHLYKATQGDLRRIMRADVIFYNGLHLEGKMQDVLEKIARQKPVIAITQNLPEANLIHYGHQHDPHIWFDVLLWQKALSNIVMTLVKHYPQHKALFEKNAERYFERLTALHQWTSEQINTIPNSQRVLITAHDAFGYFGKAYGMQVMGLQGISTATEFGLRDIAELKAFIIKNNIKAVFIESSVPRRYVESLLKGVKADTNNQLNLQIGGELFSDAMGKTGTKEGSYIGMVEHNVKSIVGALK